MDSLRKKRLRRRDFLWFAFAIGLPVPWVVSEAWQGLGMQPELVAVLSGLATTQMLETGPARSRVRELGFLKETLALQIKRQLNS